MQTKASLSALGWGPFFEKQVTEEEWNSCIAARITGVHKYSFTLIDDSGPFAATVTGNILHKIKSGLDLPVVGDWVLARPPADGTTVIVRRLERRTELSRRQPLARNSRNTSSGRQVLASNLDYVFIVMSLNKDLNPARLERALAVIGGSGATPVVLLSKADLSSDIEAITKKIRAIASGAQVHTISNVKEQGLAVVRSYFQPGVTGCLIGSSGSGKTTLINALCGTERKTLAIRENDDQGRHATTSRTLLFLPEGGMIIDSPGLREMGLMEESEPSATFTDIEDLGRKCKFSNCSHLVEPGCAVLAALAKGSLKQARYDSYMKLHREMEFNAKKDSIGRQQNNNKKQRQLGKLTKEYYKNKSEQQ